MVENSNFYRLLAHIRGETPCISWRHNNTSQVLAAKVRMLAISWRQNNGKMVEIGRSHVIDVW